MRSAHTLPELALTVTLIALCTAIAVPSVAAASARWSVRAASADVVNALVLTREAALTRGATATLIIDAARGELTVICADDTIARRAVASLHGVMLSASGDSVRYAADGVAVGVSNTTVLVARGGIIDSIVVSRLGRVRW